MARTLPTLLTSMLLGVGLIVLSACSSTTTDPDPGVSERSAEIQAGKSDIVNHVVIFDWSTKTFDGKPPTLQPRDRVLLVVKNWDPFLMPMEDVFSAMTLGGAFDVHAGPGAQRSIGVDSRNSGATFTAHDHYRDYDGDGKKDMLLHFEADHMFPENDGNAFVVEIEGINAGAITIWDYERVVEPQYAFAASWHQAITNVIVVLDLETGTMTPSSVELSKGDNLAVILLDNHRERDIKDLWQTATFVFRPEIGDEVIVGAIDDPRNRRFKQTHFVDHTDDAFFGPILRLDPTPLFSTKGGLNESLTFRYGGKSYSVDVAYQVNAVTGKLLTNFGSMHIK